MPAAETPASRVSAMQANTRQARRFSEIETSLASISQRVSAVQTTSSTFGLFLRLIDLFSRLISSKPRSQPVARTDVLWLLDNTAFQASDTHTNVGGESGVWQAEFVTAVFTRLPSDVISDAARQVAKELGISATEDKLWRTIYARILPFVMEIQPGRVLAIEVDKSSVLQLGPGGVNGISSDVRDAPRDTQNATIVSSAAKVPSGVTGVLDMKTMFAAAEGWGVISDIDDTIKITQTSDPVGILKSTFVDDATPVSGMPELYAYICKLITPASPFFYLSASPYNLYPFLRSFRDEFYPHGQLILRDASWMSISGLLSTLTLGTLEYKVDRMHKIHGWLPCKRMICLGDSTQSDPEAYGEIYRAYPGWVKIILIRKVTDIAALGIEAKNEPERFEKAFDSVPKDAWHVFEDPSECYKVINDGIV